MKLNKKIILLTSIFLLSIIAFVFTLNVISVICICFSLLAIIIVYANKYMTGLIVKANPGIFTEVRRNFDFLIIGDLNNEQLTIPSTATYLKFEAPGRSLFASYMILQNRFSWLREDGKGTCIIVTDKKNGKDNHTVSAFDIPFFHPIVIKKNNWFKQQKMLHYPILYPCKMIKFLYGNRNKKTIQAECPFSSLKIFCKERNINLIYKEI